MNSILEEMTSIHDANIVLIDLVMDHDLTLQGLMILERVQVHLINRQNLVLRQLRDSIKLLCENPSKGIH